MSQKSSLLALAGKRAYDVVECPEPIGKITMRTLTAWETISITNYRFDANGRPVEGRERYLGAKRLSLAIVDENRNPMFGEEDLEALSELPESISDMLLKKFWEMNQAEYAGEFLKNVGSAA